MSRLRILAFAMVVVVLSAIPLAGSIRESGLRNHGLLLPTAVGLVGVLGLAGWAARGRRIGYHVVSIVTAEQRRGPAALVAYALVALFVAVAILGAPSGFVLASMLSIVPVGLSVARAEVLHRVLGMLRRPPEGRIVLEGVVGDESPLGPAAVHEGSVAVSVVAVALIRPAKNGVEFEPVGEVQDVGRLDVTTDAGTFSLQLEDAALDLVVDVQVQVPKERVPAEIAAALPLQPGHSYRLRESVLLPTRPQGAGRGCLGRILRWALAGAAGVAGGACRHRPPRLTPPPTLLRSASHFLGDLRPACTS